MITNTNVANPSRAMTAVTTATGTTHSVIGTPPIYATATAQSAMGTLSLASTSASGESSSFSIGATSEASRMTTGEAAEWKVIGLAVICITFVATVILSIVFFDSWWGFLRDLVVGKGGSQGVEDLVPDSEKRSWEFKLATEDGHRYPTLASLESITREHADRDEDGSVAKSNASHPRQYPELAAPKPSHLCGYDPHPLEPLFRRPSTRPTPSPQCTAYFA